MSRPSARPARPAPPLHRFRRIAHPTPRPLDRANGLVNVFIGVPGAGKTSFYAAAADQLGTRVSLDDARALYGTGPEDQTVTQQALAHVIGEVEQLLREHQQVTVDATSTTVAERATWPGRRGRCPRHRLLDHHPGQGRVVPQRNPVAPSARRGHRHEGPLPRRPDRRRPLRRKLRRGL